MSAPFDLVDVTGRAESMADRLRSEEDYRDDFWSDEVIGPLLKAYALLTHFPDDAFAERHTDEQIASYRAYAYARMARMHAKRDGCDCMEVDGFDELMTELDAFGGKEILDAIKAGNSDANRQFAKLKKNGNIDPIDH